MIKWSLFIDIEGFSFMYRAGQDARALTLLHGLMLDLYKIGTRIYSDDFHRLFIHQFGDGFIICPYGGDKTLERPISIGIALMQSTALRDGFARAAISQGEMADILGCYPKEIQDNLRDGCVTLGLGIMTINQSMGAALINAYTLSDSGIKGPLLLLDSALKSQVKDMGVSIIDPIGIDWIHSDVALVGDILNKIDLDVPSSKPLEEIVRNYINSNKELPCEWKKSAEILIRGTKP
jgi:hypothetical protein